MKKIVFIFMVTQLLVGCNDFLLSKPKNLIDKDKMIDIIYDLSLLEAIKSQNLGVPNNYPTATEFLKTKYKVDSLSFAQSTKYYASDVEEYKVMYEKVKDKLKKKLDDENGVNRIKASEIEGGIVK